jgi:hypothetical protein
MLLTGPHGIAASTSRRTHSSQPRVAMTSATSGSSAWRFSTRFGLVAKLGWSVHSGLPTSAQKLRHIFWFATAIAIARSLVGRT